MRTHHDDLINALSSLRRTATIAAPTHFAGCCLATDHDGDCEVIRKRPRFVRRMVVR